MRTDDCYQLGEVIKTHGLKGEVSIFLDVDLPTEYENLESVFLHTRGKLIPFFIEWIQINGKKALVKFEDVDSIESATNLVKAALYLPLTNLPALPDGGYYYHDLIGCHVFEGQLNLGVVKEVIDLSGNQLLSIAKDGKELLIPMKDEVLTKVNLKEKVILVDLPEGLIDLYE